MAKVIDLPEQEFRRWVLRKLKLLEGLIDDQFESITKFGDNAGSLANEADDRAARAQRAVRRLKKEFDDHEHEG